MFVCARECHAGLERAETGEYIDEARLYQTRQLCITVYIIRYVHALHPDLRPLRKSEIAD